MNQKDIIEGLKAVCICKGIKKKSFMAHVEKGVKTVQGLKRATGAGGADRAKAGGAPRESRKY